MPNRFFPFALVPADPAAGFRAAAAAASTPIDQQLIDAFTANDDVLAYALGMTSTSLPALQSEPEWFKTFKTQFAAMKIHASKWTSSISPHLSSIPDGIADYAFSWNTAMTKIDAALEILVTDPKNKGARKDVVDGLLTLIDGLGDFQGITGKFGPEIDTFVLDIAGDAAACRQASANATRHTRHNPRKVKQLTGDLEELKGEIRSFQVVVTAAEIAAGVPFYLGACIASFTSGYGLGFGIVGAEARLTDILMASATIHHLSIKVAQDQAAMDDGSRQVAFFGTLVTNLDDLMKFAQAASERMKDLMAAWSALEAALRSVVDDLQDAAMDAVRLDIPGLQHELKAANTDWAELRERCLGMAGIKYLPMQPPTVTLPTTQAEAA